MLLAGLHRLTGLAGLAGLGLAGLGRLRRGAGGVGAPFGCVRFSFPEEIQEVLGDLLRTVTHLHAV